MMILMMMKKKCKTNEFHKFATRMCFINNEDDDNDDNHDDAEI